ncbi:MAG: non-contractile tail sheath protein, partial [Bryobacteraceae bacterium]
DGKWFTDLTATPRLNRAARDWVQSFFAALHGSGIDAAAAFSMELRDVDDSVGTGMVQRGLGGDSILLQTPSYQTNFSPTSLAFWQQVYADMAAAQIAAGLQPYLQFGEVQWWYFPNDGLGNNFSGMPFYDAWTAAQFLSAYGRAMTVFIDNTSDPALYPDEAAFLPAVIGSFTDEVMSYVRATYPTARFEVLYPVDVNQTAFNRAINFPLGSWTAAALTCLKTEGFGFTLQRSLDKAEEAMSLDGFPAAQRSHLVGIGDPTTAWLKEAQSAAGKGFESVVLFALDQFCLVGYATPLPKSFRRSVRVGR